MATTDAVAFIGDLMVSLLQDGLSGLVSPGDVVLSTPDILKTFAPTNPSVTVFLYHVSINGETRNSPKRLGIDGARHRPALPLDLKFLVTPWATQPRDSYRMAGAVVNTMYDRAMLAYNDLPGDGVWNSEDTVEIAMEWLSVSDHYRIWEATEIPYRLSLAYIARVIGIDSDLVRRPPPVVSATIPGAAL